MDNATDVDRLFVHAVGRTVEVREPDGHVSRGTIAAADADTPCVTVVWDYSAVQGSFSGDEAIELVRTGSLRCE